MKRRENTSVDSTKIEQAAATWLARRESSDWSAADESRFVQWQQQATAHRVAVIRLSAMWEEADRLQALGAGVAIDAMPAPGAWRLSAADLGRPEPRLVWQPPRLWQSMRAVKVASLLVIILGVLWTWAATRGARSYTTAVGGLQNVHLNDGTQVTLNTASAIRVNLLPGERRIELERGEAFFDVARDPHRPFVVYAGRRRIIAVGTRFSVLRTGESLRVVVTDGRVRIEEADKLGHDTGSGAKSVDEPVQLSAGAVAQADVQGISVKRDAVARAEDYLSWRSGYIALRDTKLGDAVAEFNRYNERQLVIGDPRIAAVRVGAYLRSDNLDAFLDVLEQEFSIYGEVQGERIVLTRR